MAAYSNSTGAGKRFERPGITLVDSGLHYAAFNAAILPDPLQLTELESLVSQSWRYFRTVNRPWGCWLCDDLLSTAAQSRLASLLGPYGLRLVAEHQGMLAYALRPTKRRAPDLDIRPVSTPRSRGDFAEVCGRIFSLPPDIARDVYGSRKFWESSLDGWVGYYRDVPVAIAATASRAKTIGVYSVGTLADYQRRGFGETITRHAIAYAQQKERAECVILQSTSAGLGLYARMGFQPASRFSVFMSG